MNAPVSMMQLYNSLPENTKQFLSRLLFANFDHDRTLSESDIQLIQEFMILILTSDICTKDKIYAIDYLCSRICPELALPSGFVLF